MMGGRSRSDAIVGSSTCCRAITSSRERTRAQPRTFRCRGYLGVAHWKYPENETNSLHEAYDLTLAEIKQLIEDNGRALDENKELEKEIVLLRDIVKASRDLELAHRAYAVSYGIP